MESDIADPSLAEAGRARIRWAERAMPVLAILGERFRAQRPFAGAGISACLHVTAETAGLVRLLITGGGRVRLAASNPLSTQDDVAAALAVEDGVTVFARAGPDLASYNAHIRMALGDEGPAAGTGRACETGKAARPGPDGRPAPARWPGPDLVIDDGGDLIDTLHRHRPDLLPGVRGGCESTTTGVTRLRRMAADGRLAFPVVAADVSATRRMLDNFSGTGQSVLDGLLRATNILLAGRTVVVAGYGACGAGIAERARGLGAQVIVTEVDPVRALRAALTGFRVLPMMQAASIGEVFITATGNRDVITGEYLALMRDGALLANAGHFDVEIDVNALAEAAVEVTPGVRPHADEYLMPDGRRLILLAEGRVVNLVSAEGNPPSVMDLSFAVQALALAWLAGEHARLEPGVHDVPPEVDLEVARLELESMGVRIDTMTGVQEDYLSAWRRC
jgi:adenosylhomocysteinase